MKQLPLKRVEYCIPGPGAAADGMKIRKGNIFGFHFQMTNLKIDFETRRLSLAGDIGVKVDATIYPGFSTGLSGSSSDELIFSLEGIMEDCNCISSCSGLLVLDNLTKGQGLEGRQWHATLYLYDDRIDGREIKLRLTMYGLSANAELN